MVVGGFRSFHVLVLTACFTIVVIPVSFDRNNNDSKASLKRKKSPETITDTQDASKCY